MIYESVPGDAPIRQGDIFVSLPRVAVDLERLLCLDDENPNPEVVSLNQYIQQEDRRPVVATLSVCYAIVVTQDCDAARSPMISLAQIRAFSEVEKSQPKNPKKWASLITKTSRERLGFFYLPVDTESGIADRSMADFSTLLQVSRPNLEKLIAQRKCRLGQIAREHFREQIAQYFRRYPYDEWYPLTTEEFQGYNEDKGPVEPFDWQQD